jgi:hypothetical protein
MCGAAALVVLMHLAVRMVDGSDATSFAPIDALSRASIVTGHDVYRRARAASQVKQIKCLTERAFASRKPTFLAHRRERPAD